MDINKQEYGLLFLRVTLGLLFLVPGIGKLMDPAGPIGMLTGLGFPGPTFWAWLLIIAEVACGLALIVGYKVKYAAWPLVVVLLVALFAVHLKDDPVTILFRILGIASLISVSLSGPGKFALSRA